MIYSNGLKAVPDISKIKNVFLVLTRSLNGNVIVYKLVTENHKITDLKFHWLNLDPKYRDKYPYQQECNILEKQVFGFKVLSKSDKLWQIRFNRFDKKLMSVSLTNNLQAKSFLYLDKSRVEISNLHVECRLNLLSIPRVYHVDIHGVNARGHKIKHRIKN